MEIKLQLTNEEIAEWKNLNYGVELKERMEKLKEEMMELDAEVKEGNYEGMIEELADVIFIVDHIATLIGTNIEDMAKYAVHKNLMREFNPKYKRK